MRKKQSKISPYILGFLTIGTFALMLTLWVSGALAQSQKDTDVDGFSDGLESSGFTLSPAMSLAVYPDITGQNPIPNCATAGTNYPRDKCVDPATQDLFVIIQRSTTGCPDSTCGDPCAPLFINGSGYTDIAPPSEYTDIYGTSYGPLQWVHDGLGVTTHEISQTNGTSQLVTSGGWYAVKIVEDLNPCSPWMGLSTPGTITPNAPGSATVWPEKIMNWIDKACSQACFTDARTGATTCYYVDVLGVSVPTGYQLVTTGGFICKNANNSAASVDMKADQSKLPLLYNDFIKNVISHETSHLMHLAFGPGTSADNHWPAAKGVIMEQSIGTKATMDRKGNITVTLYISSTYVKQDLAQHALK